MANWIFTTESECDLFRVHVGRGAVGDVLSVPVNGEPIPNSNPSLVLRGNYSTVVAGSIRYTPDGQSPFILDAPGLPGPWGAINIATPGLWVCEILEVGTEYVCLTAKAPLKLDYIQIMSNTMHVLAEETWAVPLGGPAMINGIGILEYQIAHKVSGDMFIETNNLVVCATDRGVI